MTRLASVLSEAGGVRAERAHTAQIRSELLDALTDGSDQLTWSRSGYDRPVVVGIAAEGAQLLAIAPLESAWRADFNALAERSWLLIAALVGALVEAACPPPPARAEDLLLRCGDWQGWLVLAYPLPAAEPLEQVERVTALLPGQLAPVDRLRAVAYGVPAAAVTAVEDLRTPIGALSLVRIAELVARLGDRPADGAAVDGHDEHVFALLGSGDGVARPHDDPDPARRIARRTLQRLMGMGKWGGYHTEFEHLARGYAGHEQALARKTGERLLAAGLLVEKTSVGQHHVFLNPRRVADIHALVDRGELPAGLDLDPDR